MQYDKTIGGNAKSFDKIKTWQAVWIYYVHAAHTLWPLWSHSSNIRKIKNVMTTDVELTKTLHEVTDISQITFTTMYVTCMVVVLQIFCSVP